MTRVIVGILLTLLIQPLYAAETMFVQSYKANIYAKPSFSARVVTQASKGQRVKALAKRKNWLQIEVDNRRGWVLNYTLSRKQPIKKVSFFDSFMGLFKSGTQKGRRRASVATATVGVRGLTAEEKRGMDQDEVAAYEAVDKMELLEIPEQELATFISAR